jgi:succinate dehydrogenase flavin-adding protein (antitoxin of CptAB toxin-antitoxin module)
MTPTMLRQVWSIIETTQTTTLLKLDDASLVEWLMKQVKYERSLDRQETDTMSNYLYSRLNLIRDLAQERY